MTSKSFKVKVTADPSLSEGIALAPAVRERVGLPMRERISLGVGATRVQVALAEAQGKHAVGIAPSLAKSLHLPLPQTLWIRFDEETDTLRLGPVVAIFAVKRRGARARSRSLFGARTLDMRQLVRHGRALGMLVYVVAPDGVNDEGKGLTGYVISGRRWSKQRLPLPDVVYDRVQSRGWERRPSTRQAKEFLQSIEGTRYFNPGFFDKWTLHQRMVEHEVLREYLPPTQPLTGPHSLRAFLEEHPSTFIKPTEGSQGKGIVRIRKLRGRWEWRTGQRRHSTTSFDALYQNIKRLQRQRRYIMQPDLKLATFSGAPFDIRILMQRNGEGEWMRTKTYARVAAKGRLTSNLSRGGTAMYLSGVLRSRFGRRRRRVAQRIRQAAGAIVRALEEVMDGPLGEVGLDFGVDRTGRVWLIEANSKPYRKVFDAGPKRGVRLSFRRPMAFAKYLAGF